MQTFENFFYSTQFLDIAHKWSLGILIKVCSNGGATYIIQFLKMVKIPNNFNAAIII